MNLKSFVRLIPCVLLAALCVAQTATPTSPVSSNRIGPISGIGNRGYLAKFAGANQINNSNIFQASTGDIGIGTATPFFPLHILSGSTIQQGHVPTSLYVENQASQP